MREKCMYRKQNFSPAADCITFFCKAQCKQGLYHWMPLSVSLWYIDNTDRKELTVQSPKHGEKHVRMAPFYVFCSQFTKASILWRLKTYTLAYINILDLHFLEFIFLFPHLLMYMVAEVWTESNFICRSPYITGQLALHMKPDLHFFVFTI